MSNQMSSRWLCLLLLALGMNPATGGQTLRSADAYLRTEGARWTLGTSAMERVVALRIKVLGERDPHATGTAVHLDGVRVER